jgi:predicted Zn-ribbon and HTH transcriptional regulator
VLTLRSLLLQERDPIDRHFMLSELSQSLYKCRDVLASALDEFDEVCEQHQLEMEDIRPALLEKFGELPLVEMYRQSAIRCQKARDWKRVELWTERGLAFYGTQAARPESVDDLAKRLAHAHTKIDKAGAGAGMMNPTASITRSTVFTSAVEILTCRDCGSNFERERTRGRKPHLCPACHSAGPAAHSSQ